MIKIKTCKVSALVLTVFLSGLAIGEIFLQSSALASQPQASKASTKQSVDVLLKDTINTYNDGQYDRAMQLCKKVLTLEPQNLTAHYFLGNICVKTNRLSDAVLQYKYCLQLPAAKNSSEAQYAKQALTQIEQQNALSHSAAQSLTKPAGSSAPLSGSTRGAEAYIQEQTDILTKEQNEKVAVKQHTLDGKITQIQDEVKQQILSMPRAGMRRVAAQEARQDAQDQIRQDAQKRIDQLKADFSREVADLDQYYQNRISALSDYQHNLQQNNTRSGRH